jgi:hypothetical protein
LLPVEYSLVQETIVTNPSVATTRDSPAGFMTMIHVARTCPEWQALVDRLLELADRVDCDLPGIWKTLEDGRMEWLTAINGAQTLKSLLLEMLKRDSATNSVGDVSDAKMIWMYSLSCKIPALEAERQNGRQRSKRRILCDRCSSIKHNCGMHGTRTGGPWTWVSRLLQNEGVRQ